MTAVEIILILIGVAFLIGSYFIEERFSDKDVQKMAKMSETQLNMVVEKQVSSAQLQIENSVEEIIDDSLASTKRNLEKTTNEKIMAINEYSDTVLDSMNKTHNEIMFLYSMLNDKHSEMTELVGTIQKYTKEEKTEKQEKADKSERTSKTEKDAEPKKKKTKAPVKEKAVAAINIDRKDINEQILKLHKEGKTDVAIAKALNCGLGEVRLVLGLYKEE